MKFSNEFIPVAKKNNPKNDADVGRGPKAGEPLYCRDPFILPYNRRYYLYKTIDEFGKNGKGIECLVSEDLQNWSLPVTVFAPPENFHGVDHFFWAPECHYYNGNFYIFTSVLSEKHNNHHVISVYRSDNPLGPFEDIAGGCITPPDWDTIDGTLYIDKQGAPWMVFVHEWTSMPDKNGTMVAAKLSGDFTKLISEPIHLFSARDPEWAVRGVTDGPFLYRTDGGTLYMIWSNMCETGYAVGLAKSDNGEIDGKWSQEGLLYGKNLRNDFELDGGHGMIFRKFDGEITLALHSPNKPTEQSGKERLTLKTLTEKEDKIRIL